MTEDLFCCGSSLSFRSRKMGAVAPGMFVPSMQPLKKKPWKAIAPHCEDSRTAQLDGLAERLPSDQRKARGHRVSEDSVNAVAFHATDAAKDPPTSTFPFRSTASAVTAPHCSQGGRLPTPGAGINKLFSEPSGFNPAIPQRGRSCQLEESSADQNSPVALQSYVLATLVMVSAKPGGASKLSSKDPSRLMRAIL